MNDFQNASFVPFEHYVNKARAMPASSRAVFKQGRSFGSRRVDFTDAVIVSEVPMRDVPEFADTVPMIEHDESDTGPMELPEVSDVPIDIVVTDNVFSTEDVIASKVARARNFIASRAFTECLQSGFFPPRCQACGR